MLNRFRARCGDRLSGFELISRLCLDILFRQIPRFTDPFAAANVGTPLNQHLHPTQLYESGAELLILLFLLWFEKRGRPFPGRTFWTYMLVYAVSRFIIEFYRGDPRGLVLGVTTSQFISIVLVPLSLFMLWRLSRQPDPESLAATRAAA